MGPYRTHLRYVTLAKGQILEEEGWPPTAWIVGRSGAASKIPPAEWPGNTCASTKLWRKETIRQAQALAALDPGWAIPGGRADFDSEWSRQARRESALNRFGAPRNGGNQRWTEMLMFPTLTRQEQQHGQHD